MYSPFGSYSSMSSPSEPLDIAPSSYLARSSPHDASCAFPSWPRRDSLLESHGEHRATSYLSDDDLFLLSLDDDAQSIDGAHSSSSSNASGSPQFTDEDLLEMQRQQAAAVQREALRFLHSEKERRRQQAMRKPRRSSSSGSSKKSPKTKATATAAMAPIYE